MKSILNHASSIISALLLLSTTMRLHAATTNYVALHSGGIYDGTCWATAFTNVQELTASSSFNGAAPMKARKQQEKKA